MAICCSFSHHDSHQPHKILTIGLMILSATLDLLVGGLKKVQKMFSQMVVSLMVMNPMGSQSVKISKQI